ncbi:MAG: hypothetical protein XD98_0410 [Microgenomates bacterium 39_6]|nr:MAG: hypothetical protein XD98_0410 [Microgenomates bacterium 39_6]
MTESQLGPRPEEKETNPVSVSQLIELTEEKRQKFGIDKKPDGSLAQEEDGQLKENIRANTEPVLAYLKELQKKEDDSFSSFDELITALNKIAKDKGAKSFPKPGDIVSFNTSGKIVRVGLGEDFVDEYFDEAIVSPHPLLCFSGANAWDNPPQQFPKSLFLPINYVIEEVPQE